MTKLERPSYPRDDVFLLVDFSKAPTEKVSRLYTEAQVLVHRELVTYGGLNMDVLYPQLAIKAEMKGLPLNRTEVAPGEDEIVGLRIPRVWYFSQNLHNVSMAMYYINMQKEKVLGADSNQALRKEYGVVGIIECYKRDELQDFAKAKGYAAFSVPFDMVVTARHMAKHIDRLDESTPDKRHVAFMREIIDFAATAGENSTDEVVQKLAFFDEKTRLTKILETIKGFWQTVLVPRGIQPGDEDIILVDTQKVRLANKTLDHTRSPFVVFVGGNMENPVDSEVVKRNVDLAKSQYPPETRIIVPRYTDGIRQWHATLNKADLGEITPDLLLTLLLAIQELGLPEYEDLWRRYEELSQQ